MSELSIAIAVYTGCAFIGFLIGFLELLRKSILSWLPIVGTPFMFSDKDQGYAYWNSFLLLLFLYAIFVICGFPDLLAAEPDARIPWSWQKPVLCVVFIILGEWTRLKFFELMEDPPKPKARTIITKADFNESVDAKLRADFQTSDHANHFLSYEDYKASL